MSHKIMVTSVTVNTENGWSCHTVIARDSDENEEAELLGSFTREHVSYRILMNEINKEVDLILRLND